ncbi:MAG: formate--tetrahydrofolate ligase, partial [Verrucomicrobia bacterium]|nr:formate--tetrahydrofolate ligase [Verrucomicrobiota bacterium]
GGAALDQLTQTDTAALTRGLENLAAHLASAAQFGRPVIVAVNRFTNDHEEELALVHEFCQTRGVACATADVFGQGGDGATQLAETVLAALPTECPPLPMLYQVADRVEAKLTAIATKIYGADAVQLTDEARTKLTLFASSGFDRLPLCMAKTQNSLSDDATKRGRPRGFTITVRDFEIANGAGFLVALTGAMMRMPALPKVPAAERIQVSEAGEVSGISTLLRK